MPIDEQAYPLCKEFNNSYSDLSVPLLLTYAGYYYSQQKKHAEGRMVYSWGLRIMNYRQNPDSQPGALKVGQFLVQKPDTISPTDFLPYGETSGYFWVYFTGSYADQLMQNLQLEPDVVYTLQDSTMSDIRQDFKLLFQECSQKKPGYQDMTAAILMTILVRLSRNCSSDQPTDTDRVKKRLEKTVLYIQSNFSDSRLNVAQLAEQAKLSVSRYRELFRDFSGMSPSDYIMQTRINHACHLLRNTALNIHQIASYCSYQDLAYFSRLFRKKTGLSPTEYRDNFTKP